jgi:hypothetical protein
MVIDDCVSIFHSSASLMKSGAAAAVFHCSQKGASIFSSSSADKMHQFVQ